MKMEKPAWEQSQWEVAFGNQAEGFVEEAKEEPEQR